MQQRQCRQQHKQQQATGVLEWARMHVQLVAAPSVTAQLRTAPSRQHCGPQILCLRGLVASLHDTLAMSSHSAGPLRLTPANKDNLASRQATMHESVASVQLLHLLGRRAPERARTEHNFYEFLRCMGSRAWHLAVDETIIVASGRLRRDARSHPTTTSCNQESVIE